MKEHVITSARLLAVFTLLLGLVYPAVVWAVGLLVFPTAAGGSFVPANGRVVGSALIGQAFAAPEHFHSRPSGAGDKGYDATSSSGTNLGPTSKKLAESIATAVDAVRKENPGQAGPVPADAVTSSGSGLDPHVSPEYARWQVARVAAATGIPAAELTAMVEQRTEGRFLGIYGEPRVNVLLLNLDVDAKRGTAAR